MAIPNGGGGYQVGDGNLNEPLIDALPDPIVVTAAATLTAVQVLNGIMILNTAVTTSNQAYTLPTVADLEAVLTNSDKVGTAFTFRVVNLGTSSGTATITTNTGWTLTGSLTMAVPVTSGAFFIARKSAAGAWTLYRVA
jgi:Flp pilus assembly CpaE family ATPase